MTFVDIRMLFLIWAVPLVLLLYIYGSRKRRRILTRFASPVGLASIAPDEGKQAPRRGVKAALVCLTLLFAAIALSGPRYGYSWKEVERRGIDIIIALDCSRSMLAQDIQPTRLDRAKREVYDLLDMLQGDRIGLVAFAGTAFLQCPLTLDYSAFHLFLESLSPEFLPLGGTDLPGAVTTALAGFDENTNSEKAIILITDGESTAGNPIEAAEAASKAGVKLFAIGVGRPEGVPIPDPAGGFKKDATGQIILTKLDEKTLAHMALATGGTYARSVAGDMDLDVIYTEKIRGEMVHASLTSTRQQVWEDRYQWPLGVAILLLVIELLIPVSSRKPAGSRLLALSLAILTGWPTAVDADPMQDAESAYSDGAYEKSLDLYIERQLDEPDRSEVLYNIGNAYYKLGNFDAAATHFQQATESEEAQMRERALYNLGNAAFRKGEMEEAITHYEAALQIDPQDRQAKENLEFVKQVMAQQKKQQSSENQQEKKDQGQKNPEKKDGGDNTPSSDPEGNDKENSGQPPPRGEKGDEKEETPQPEYGKETDPPQGQDSPPSGPSQQPENTDTGKQADPPSQDRKNTGTRQAAEGMLNRLEDKPGKAMIRLTKIVGWKKTGNEKAGPDMLAGSNRRVPLCRDIPGTSAGRRRQNPHQPQ